MTAQIQYPETIAFYLRVTKTDTGELYEPATTMQISVYDPTGTEIVSNDNMTEITPVTIDTISYNYVYYYATTGSSNMGTYRIRYTATNGSYVTIQDDSFVLSRTGV